MKRFLIFLFLILGLGYVGYYYVYLPNLNNDKMGIYSPEGEQLVFPKDSPYILAYIQSWCRDCIAETPCLMDFSKQNQIPIYFVTDEDSLLMKRYRKRFDYPLPIYYSKTKLKDAGILLFPTIYFFGKNHQRIDYKQERVDSAVLTNYLKKLNAQY